MALRDLIKNAMPTLRRRSKALVHVPRQDPDAEPEPITAEPDSSEPTSPPEPPRSDPPAPPDNSMPVPMGLHIAASWSWRLLLIAALIVGIGWCMRYLSHVVVPLAVAILLTALLSPIANRLIRWGWPRGLSVAISVIGGLAVVGGVLTFIVQQIVSQSGTLVERVVQGFLQLTDWLQNGPLPIDPTWLNLNDWTARITDFISSSQTQIAAYAADVGGQVGTFLAGFAITLFTLFYFLYDGRGIWSFILKFFPKGSRTRVDHAALNGWNSLVSYVRATIFVAFVDAVGVLIVAIALQVPLAPALAALVFLGAFVPLVGALISGFLAVLVALVTLGWVQALIMLAGIIVVQQLEGHILQPFLLGRAVKLHPLAVLLGLAVGIVLAGLVGALIAIPILAFAKNLIQDLVESGERLSVIEPPIKT